MPRAQAPHIVYRDAHLLVLDKPVGIATTAPEGESLFSLARELDPNAPALHPLSRLDTQVSGLTTFARTDVANRVAMEARKAGTLRRSYLGIAACRPEQDEGAWKHAIGIDPRDPKHRKALPEGTEGAGIKAAHTRYRVIAIAGPLIAFDFWPLTGRTHQLRVHAAANSCPLLGDVAYGGSKRLTLDNGRILTAARVMLHCAAFRMPDPAEPHQIIRLALPPPPDMSALWRSAGGDPEALGLRVT